ncbi:MAG TPA: hypothetical protein VHU18_13560 [Rhizomicrobium sp.]|jgi:hypothetical protein|nr:hypothetical protein [Rhizomicrobium sp.]
MTKRAAVIAASTVLIALLAIYGINYLGLQRFADDVVGSDPRDSGIRMSVHYAYYVDPEDIVVDLRSVENASKLDVTRVLLQTAAKLSGRQFDHVYLASRGKRRFMLLGSYFRQVGLEYPRQNPMYTIRTMPENVLGLNGEHPYQTWTGGILGVLAQQMRDFSDFEDRWFAAENRS